MSLSPADVTRYLDAALDAARAAAPGILSVFRDPDLVVERKPDETPVTIADRNAEVVLRESLRAATPELGIHGEEFGSEGDASNRWVLDPIDGTKNFVDGLPYFATLIGLQIDGECVLGVVHCPALGDDDRSEVLRGITWWGARGAGAFRGDGTRRESASKSRLRIRGCDDLGAAHVQHGGLRHFQNLRRWNAWTEIVRSSRRTRGFGDFWGHMLVAEGRADAMVDPVVALHDLAAVRPIVEEAGAWFGSPDATEFDVDFHGTSVTCAPPLRDRLLEILARRDD